MIHCCENCGAKQESNARFCAQCGRELPQVAPVQGVEAEALRAEIVRLHAELESVEDAIEIQSFGFYEPRYGFETSKEYVDRVDAIRDEQKAMIRDKSATVCPRNWVVDGSLVKGRQMMAEHSQLMLRAFNGDCDAAIARVRYDNVARIEKRTSKAFEAINKLGATKRIAIAEEYLQKKLAELHLVHEHREKLYEEKEEQREIRERMREEQRAEKEIEKASRDAEEEEQRYAKSLEEARAQLDKATGAQVKKLEGLVQKLEQELGAAVDRKAKSMARAQLTRSGHVYVLSNVGSFGEGIYKIGMTRRLEPLERVNELGDASVPFRFDVHAMIYSEDAPRLENALHEEFAARRVNCINLRREYFRVTIDEIMAAVERRHGTVTFVTKPEAEEFRKSSAIRADEELSTRSSAGQSEDGL